LSRDGTSAALAVAKRELQQHWRHRMRKIGRV
jgi:hypothetical protein